MDLRAQAYCINKSQSKQLYPHYTRIPTPHQGVTLTRVNQYNCTLTTPGCHINKSQSKQLYPHYTRIPTPHQGVTLTRVNQYNCTLTTPGFHINKSQSKQLYPHLSVWLAQLVRALAAPTHVRSCVHDPRSGQA